MVLAPISVSSETITERVFEAIRDAITQKLIPPGERISEVRLASQLQVSKTPVREALIRLRHVGLVEMKTSGLHVVRPSPTALRDVFEYREALETMSARLAVARADSHQLWEIRSQAEESLRAAERRDRASFRQYDVKFHISVARASGNKTLLESVENAIVLASVLRFRDIPDESTRGDSRTCARAHVDIAEALENRAPQTASELMSAHIQHVLGIVASDRSVL